MNVDNVVQVNAKVHKLKVQKHFYKSQKVYLCHSKIIKISHMSKQIYYTVTIKNKNQTSSKNVFFLIDIFFF